MKRAEEWDWPPTQRHYRRTINAYPDAYQPSGWNSPVAKKAVNIYWRVMITCLKVILIGALAIMAFCASWLIVTVLTL